MAITLDLLDSTFHSVAIADSSGQALAIDSSGFLTSNINGVVSIDDNAGSITVDAVDLDIRSISGSSDNISITDSTGANSLDVDASGFLTVNAAGGSFNIADGGGSITVDSVDFDIRSLNAGTDDDHLYITDSTGANSLAVQADGSLNVNSTRSGFGSYLVTAETVGTTESEIVSTPASGRVSILVQNLSNSNLYFRESTGVTTANGIKIPKGGSYAADLDESCNLFCISDGAGSDVRVLEYIS